MKVGVEFQEFQTKYQITILLWLLVVIVLIMGIVLGFAIAKAEEVDLAIIAQIESSGNPMAVSYAGAKYGRGLYQISEICLADYNRAKNTKISSVELFSPKVSRLVAFWYLNEALPLYLRNKGIPVTLANVLAAYNWGIGNLARYGIENAPQETKNYIKKYETLAEVKNVSR